MPIIATAKGKDFETPDTGMYHGILADVVDLGLIKTTYQGKEKEQHMIRLIWVLDKNGKDGAPLTVQQRFPLSLHEKANLYKAVKQILNAAPPQTYDIELLLGQTRKLFIMQEPNKAGDKMFANVKGITPADKGVTVALPAGFVRSKDKNKETPGPQQQPASVAPPVGHDAEDVDEDIAF